ncbi:nucleotidyl transferase AbiEii/AbiGii toxin family protein [Diaphorobacter aerolatus]|uniref:nucleotidyl transferase AbiEii/AbiGii toxin family protein n=1 Tax=Diaphorobacter aerolatus TaxID=1288495 RepID=UPI00299F71E7|nr:nucleotidyl transferase AbiEii/AbiGii toxin family protein [Diaphorobacter aerolatus]
MLTLSVAETLAEKILSFLRRFAQHRSGQTQRAWDTALVRHIYDVHCIVTRQPELVEVGALAFGPLVAGTLPSSASSSRTLPKIQARFWRRRSHKQARTDKSAPNTKRICCHSCMEASSLISMKPLLHSRRWRATFWSSELRPVQCHGFAAPPERLGTPGS